MTFAVVGVDYNVAMDTEIHILPLATQFADGLRPIHRWILGVVGGFYESEVIMENKTIEILQHNISYWYEDDQEMPDYEQDHVKKMITDGISSGQLVDSDENTGWWKIDN